MTCYLLGLHDFKNSFRITVTQIAIIKKSHLKMILFTYIVYLFVK